MSALVVLDGHLAHDKAHPRGLHVPSPEKIVEIDFVNGQPVRASDQFGKGTKR